MNYPVAAVASAKKICFHIDKTINYFTYFEVYGGSCQESNVWIVFKLLFFTGDTLSDIS